MLESTFLHLKGVGARRERGLWAGGVHDWTGYNRALAQHELFGPTGDPLSDQLQQSRAALLAEDAAYFAARLPRAEHYRIALSFPEDAIFLDIETTGLSLYYDDITIIGASIGDEYRFFCDSQDVNILAEWLLCAKCIVTFNGTLFDLKFLRKRYQHLRIPPAHVDLRFLARSVGFVGGQKEIERSIGFERVKDASLSGAQAPILWHAYRLGDHEAFRALVEYNRSDIEGMKAIFDAVVDRLTKRGRLPASASARAFTVFRTRPVTWMNGSPANGGVAVPLPQPPKPRTTYSALIGSASAHPPTVVGIDLTGSSKRPTGWCVLRGSVAEVARLATDDDIFTATLAAAPHLVSIDSPLCLPDADVSPGPVAGQTSIMRECERVLKRRGVNVYPCLIPSMRALTHRGMNLAARFRAAGVPVIESYPGAAQDIMGIPRKRAGLSYLVGGLADFGLSGNFMANGVSHDEVDAVTAALVGTFFWTGRFEPLGNEREDYLIVPDLRVRKHKWLDRIVVGISGPIAAGKTTAASALRERGYAYARYSEVLAELLRERGQPVNRQSLQELGDHVNRHEGQRWLGERLIGRFSDSDRHIVIDGLRFPEDHAFYVERCGASFLHIHIEAPLALRRKRYLALGSDAEEFDRASAHPVERNVRTLGRLAHVSVRNKGGVDELEAQVLAIVRQAEARMEARCPSP